MINEHFSWQEKYIAVFVGYNGIVKVREYIKNQEENHQKKIFIGKWDSFWDKYGFEILMK